MTDALPNSAMPLYPLDIESNQNKIVEPFNYDVLLM
jgi:hypothetical protein